MIVGVPREIKTDEYRVAMLPVGAEELTSAGHQVLIEAGAGQGSGIADALYASAGATMVEEAGGDLGQGRHDRQGQGAPELGVAAASPGPGRLHLLSLRRGRGPHARHHRQRHHGDRLRDPARPRGGLPLLTPMSEVAGRMSIQEGARFLERPQEGRGILLAGVPGVAPAEVAILGGGVVGSNAAKVAAGLGANVRILDVNLDRLRYLDDIMPPNVTTLYSDRHTIRESIERADLVVGAVLITGARAPRLVRRQDLGMMKTGAVIVDVAIDQGGCIETSRPTTHLHPTYVVDGVVHYCVTNMPGAVGRTSTYALCNVTLPYVLQLANHGWRSVSAVGPGSGRGSEYRSGACDEPGRRRDLRPRSQPT